MSSTTPPSADGRSTRRPGRFSGAVMVVGSCASLQLGAAIASLLFPQLGSWGTTALRLGLSAIIMLLIVRPRVRGWKRPQWLAVIALGATLAGMNGFFYEALSRIPLGVAVSIEFLGPLALAAVLSRRPRDLIWVGLALAGIALFFLDTSARDEPLDPVGVLAVLAAAAFWAGYILCSHRVGQVTRGHGGLTVGMTVAALIVLPFGVPVVPVLAQDALLLAAAAGAAVFASVIPYTLELAALRRLPRPVFGILLSLEPVLATLAGALILGQGVSVLGGVAVVVIVTASVGSTATSREVHAEPTVS